MLRLKFIVILSLVLLCSSMGFSQAASGGFYELLTPIGPNYQIPDLNSMQMKQALFTEVLNKAQNSTTAGADLSKVAGSPYFDRGFENSSLWYKKELIGSYHVRYNAFQDQLEVKNSNLAEEEYQFLVQSSELKTKINGKEVQYFSHKDADGTMSDSYFFKEFAGDDFILYTNQRKKYSPPKASSNTLAQSIPAKFMDDISLYYRTSGNDVLHEIPKRKNDFFEIFPAEKRTELKKYVKAKRLKISDLDNLKSIVIHAGNL